MIGALPPAFAQGRANEVGWENGGIARIVGMQHGCAFLVLGGAMVRLKALLILLLILGLGVTLHGAEPAPKQSLQQLLRAHAAAVAVVELPTGAFFRFDEERCRQPFPALNTIQVPLALLALDAGILKDPQTVLAWNRLKYPLPEDETVTVWGQDHTLRSAFQQTVPWFFQELAQRIGPAALQRGWGKLNYGQPDFQSSTGVGEIGERLAVSIEEQLAFLQRLYEMRLPISKQAQRTVRELLIHEETANYTLRSVAGYGMLENGKSLGWLVGWLETRTTVCVFALNLTGADSEAVREPARQLLREVLVELEYLPK